MNNQLFDRRTGIEFICNLRRIQASNELIPRQAVPDSLQGLLA